MNEYSTIALFFQTLAVGSSLVATFAYSISMYSLNPKFFKALVDEGRVRVLATCIPVFLGVISIQFVHEAAHYFVAKRREIKIGKPLPLFSPGLGLYGCITQLKSFPANRAALLDFALSGPFAAIVVSLVCIFAGISLTTRASTLALSNFPFVPAAVLKSSFLVGSIFSSLASKTLMVPLSQPIPIHPLFVIGYSGLIASALNLLPIFRLDGGRAFSAAMGSRQTAIISVSSLLVLISQSLSGGSGVGLVWGLMVLFFQRREEIPARDEVTEVDNFRFGTWVFSQLLSAAVLMPFPGHRGII
jgi:membrane-associated protease RseP (regulator of RpoE activity)